MSLHAVDLPQAQEVVILGSNSSADTFAASTIEASKMFDECTSALSNLGNAQDAERWPGDWQKLFSMYKSAVKASLELDKLGIDYFGELNPTIANRLDDWAENNFGEAKRFLQEYLEKPAVPQLRSASSVVSDQFTDIKNVMQQFENNFVAFVGKLEKDDEEAQAYLARQIQQLKDEIAHSTIFDDKQRLKDEELHVEKNLEVLCEMDKNLEIAKTVLSTVRPNIGTILDDLQSFAMQWIKTHHDIEALLDEMGIAEDSATKRSLISRLKAIGTSAAALVADMNEYVTTVQDSGIFE
ncbi:hypothetical protein CVT24_011081 [Panaeolus cyanescens]|uniref:Uncharacterized protein n=1 Tax=Panaeolus cyanescens TaxID=181874 RepID=A0A409YYC5_9AGAR|nr:hypothetical protein CVT24_011081 [Panaeolus cyanescens]